MHKLNLVAIIDDDELVRFIEKKVIESTNLVNEIRAFSSGQEAIDFLKTNSKRPDLLPEVILLDLNMPGMDGFEFLEKYIVFEPRLDKKITIFVVTSSDASIDINRIKEISEVSGFIIKPITKQKFEHIVRELKRG
jgi:CheY-like chemotaxis protein